MNGGFDAVLGDPLARPRSLTHEGQRALIVGGGLSGMNGGIGFSSAWLLAQGGAVVAIADRDPGAAARAVAILRENGADAHAIVGDVTVAADCARMVSDAAQTLGTLDTVVTTVAKGRLEGLFDVDPAEWHVTMQMNVTATWMLLKQASAFLRPGAAIVTTSSVAAIGRGPGTPYAVSKAALEQLTIGAAATLAPRGVRVNAVRVGTVWSSFAARGFDEQTREIRRRSVALQEEGNVWDAAHAIAYLSGPTSRWVTGQIITVDGGGQVAALPGHPTAPMSVTDPPLSGAADRVPI